MERYKNIIEDFIKLQDAYPPLIDSHSDFISVKETLTHLRDKGHNKKMVELLLKYFYELKNKEEYEEAGQILLASSLIDDNTINFILARELHTGVIFVENRAAAFGILSKLEEVDCAEALSDLGFYYQNGIVVEKDISKAISYYEKAISLGLVRATKSLNKLRGNTKSSKSTSIKKIFNPMR